MKKWFELNGVKVDWERIDFPTSRETSEVDRAPTKDELKVLPNHASSSRDRAALLMLTSGGFRVGTLLSLKVGDVDFNYPDVACIKVEKRPGRKFTTSKRAGRQGKALFTFITPEAKKALGEYLEERKRTEERLTPESPLIGDAYHKGEFVSIESFDKVWARLLKRAGLADKSNRWYQLPIHILRKYFCSNCVGVAPSFREHWMGHQGGYLDESYFRAEMERHLTESRKVIPHLTICGTALEEKQLRPKMPLDFARLQGYSGQEFKRLEEVLARAKDIDEVISEFKRFKDKPETLHNGNGYTVVEEEAELLRRLENGWRLVQPLNHEKYLLQHS